jgi:hypothetical protein
MIRFISTLELIFNGKIAHKGELNTLLKSRKNGYFFELFKRWYANNITNMFNAFIKGLFYKISLTLLIKIVFMRTANVCG